jgi:TatD DNase family protein|tara:strand:- start:398 stop:1174 length:777 start_codon:yes stop_codon:yes gene_type:complete
MLIDVHCHLDFKGLRERMDEVVANAEKVGVKAIITSGINPETNRLALEYASKYDIVKASFGLYPIDALEREDSSFKPFDVDDELKFLKENKDKFICVGEVGLDLHSGKDIDRQKEIFKKVLELAKKLDKPVLIHSRKAESEALDMLEEVGVKKVVMHCFTAKKSLVKRAYDNGYYFSIPPVAVRLQQFQDMIEMIDINHLLTETDAPFLSPFKNEDGSFNVNEPAYVIETVKKIAEIKKMDIEEVKKNLWMNFQKVFL